MQKAQKISGFPEWLPEEKLLENKIIKQIKEVYESHGFVPIETPAVELIETLTSKGVVDKEIYGLRRLAAAADEKDAELGLHFDLTVPFARYVATHFNSLHFPFRRYQLQKVWRGERPQKGRFREFYQFDADIVARDELPIFCDAEVVTLLTKCLKSLNIGTPKIRLNNRKLLIGFLKGFLIKEDSIPAAITIIDKLDKISAAEAENQLVNIGLDSKAITSLLEFAAQALNGEEFARFISSANLSTDLAVQGTEELLALYNFIPENLKPLISFDFRIARGLDYYTGTIVESQIVEYPEFGSVGSGGRYDGLVNNYLSKPVPGVGISLGLTRIMDLVLREKLLSLPAQSTAKILLAIFSEDERVRAIELAEQIRYTGIAIELFPRQAKISKQIEYADKKGIPYVLFVGEKLELKNLKTGQQQEVNSPEELPKLITGP
jgi:histidyl-tRNA synthetase